MRTAFRYGTPLLAALALAFAAHAGDQDFELVNKTGVDIHELYVSPHSADEWEEDILGRDTLPDGESVEIEFDDRENRKRWDLKVVDGEGNSIEWENLKLVDVSVVKLHFKKGKAWADVK